MGHPVAFFDVPASQNAHDGCIGELTLGIGQRLRHGTVPSQLSLDETFEFALRLCFRQRCLIGRRNVQRFGAQHAIGSVGRQHLLYDEYASELALICRSRWSGLGKPFSLRGRNTFPSFLADLRDKGALYVQGYHWDSVETSELKQGHVESSIVVPNLSPF